EAGCDGPHEPGGLRDAPAAGRQLRPDPLDSPQGAPRRSDGDAGVAARRGGAAGRAGGHDPRGSPRRDDAPRNRRHAGGGAAQPVSGPRTARSRYRRPAVDYQDILYEVRGGVATVTINRPAVYNAFRATTCEELIDAFRRASWDREVGVVVLTGTGGKAFCT